VLGILIGVLAAIIPARRAAHLDPLKALTYE
jgi:ABC-type antimicrobial peptide transport system permease subunit